MTGTPLDERVRRTRAHRGPVRLRSRGVMTAVFAAVIVVIPGAPTTQAVGADEITINGLRLERCESVTYPGTRAWCGSLQRPIDAGSSSSLPIHFTLTLPASARPNSTELAAVLGRPLIAAFEGGPGYGGIDSGDAYAQMLGPLMAQRAMLVMDARGTGRSGAINCRSLQRGIGGFLKAARTCARQLGSNVDDYGTAKAADDAAALIAALGFQQADVYGDSYGTFMAQVLAGRHPALIRSLVLDGAYPVTGESAWYPTQGPALSRALTQVCDADPVCSAYPDGTVDQLSRLLDRLRKKPLAVTAPGGDGIRHRVRITPENVLDVAFNGTYIDATYREFDPAVRAALAGDPLPLGRLVAEVEYPAGYAETARENSTGQFLAVTCHDYPLLYDMSAATPVRREQLRKAIAEARKSTPGLFAPFTIDEYVDSSWETLYDCLTWAQLAPSDSRPPAPPSGVYPDVPVLVLSGSLDTITTTAEGDMVAAQFPRSRHVEVLYGVHVQAMGATVPCAAELVRSFFQDPEAVVAVDPAPCANPRPQQHETFARTAQGIDEGRAAVLTVADVVNRVRALWSDRGRGLRGGTWTASYIDDDEVTMRLDEVRFFEDLPVSGTARWIPSRGSVRAAVSLPGGRFTIEWSDASDGVTIRDAR